MMHRNATNAVRPPSLVDTLSSGFRALHRALPALLVPVILDLWYWLGPRISLQPLLVWLRSLNPVAWDESREQIKPFLPEGWTFDLRTEGILEERLLFWFWRRISTLVPSNNAVQPLEPTTWYIGGFLALFGTFLVLNLVFSLLVVLYLLPLADVVRGSVESGSLVGRVLSAWLRILGVQGIVLVLLIVAGIPLLVVVGAIAQIAPVVGSFLASMIIAIILWLMLTTSFAYDAVVLNQSNPVRALLSSLLVVRTSLWSVVGLYVLTAIILSGLGVIWQGLETTLVGMLVAVCASAYIGTGLAAAHLVFYHNRLLARASTA